MDQVARLDAFVDSVPGTLLLSSSQARWESLLLREYRQPDAVEEFWTAPTRNQTIVMTTAGLCEIECHAGARWRQATYRPGSLGFTRPQESAQLRWRKAVNKRTLHVHLPMALLDEVAAQLSPDQRRTDLPDALADRDPALSSLLASLRQSVLMQAPDLYAESSAHLLALHLLLRRDAVPRRVGATMAALARVDERLHAAVTDTVSLADLAAAAGMTRFQLLRAANANWGETPMRRLTRLRVERACELLTTTRLSITEIALDCGYGSSAHFATAFRRQTGIAPSAYRAR